MHFIFIALSFPSLLRLSSSSPTPIQIAPRCCTTLAPHLQPISELDSGVFGINPPMSPDQFQVQDEVDANGKQINRVHEIVAFTNIPPKAFNCQLSVSFPANYPIISTGVPVLEVRTLYINPSSGISYDDNMDWSDVYASQFSSIGQDVFGTITLTAGTTEIINSEACPTNGGTLAFIFSISISEMQAASVQYNQCVNSMGGISGVFMTYNC